MLKSLQSKYEILKDMINSGLENKYRIENDWMRMLIY
jgi:hypothetical protein